MIPAAASSAPYAPIFDWDAPRARKASLAGFIAASAFFHALCFYIFQIVYPPTVALLPPPARVNLITGDSEAGRILWRWVEAEDPALSSTTQRPADVRFVLPPVPAHIPSYASHQPALKQLPPYQPDLRIPSSDPPGPVRLATPARSPAPIEIIRSSLRFVQQSEVIGAPEIPHFTFTASSGVPPAAAQFRIGLSAHGVIRYCFLESSSGDPALDEQARRIVLLCRFPAMGESSLPVDQLIWTVAAFEWGNDLVLPVGPKTEAAEP